MKNREFFKDVFPGGNKIHTNEEIITRKKEAFDHIILLFKTRLSYLRHLERG